MSMDGGGLSVADALALSRDNGGNGNGAFGDDGFIWIIFLFFIMAWGGNGMWGGNGNGSGVGTPSLQGLATRADINEGFALNGIQNGISSLQTGLCDSTYALNNAVTGGFNTTNMALCNGFNGVQQGFNQLGYQMQDCCCQTQRAIDGVNYNMATQDCETRSTIQNSTRDILENNNNNTRAILDFLTQDKISSLTSENQTLKFQASQTAQNGYIDAVSNSVVARLQQPQPVPAYSVPAPYPFGNCGCNTGCC